MGRLQEKIGASMRRAPFVWLLLLLLVEVVMMPGIGSAEPKRHEEWIGWVAAAAFAYCVVLSLVLMPRVLLPQMRQRMPIERITAMRWTFAVVPYFLGLTAFVFGAYEWVLGAGFVVNAGLLVAVARSTRREVQADT